MNVTDLAHAFNSLSAKLKWHLQKSRVVHLKPAIRSRGNVLISYIIEPFLLKRHQPIPSGHTSYWECVRMAETFLELGYAVDVINSYNRVFYPKKDYDFFIEHRTVLERVAPYLNAGCIKIMHIDTAHTLFHNAAEANRLLDLQRRRGVTLSPRRFMMPNLAIEHADYATILGNDFTVGTFAYAKKPMYRIPISATTVYDWPGDKDFEASRNHFIWLNSGGLVHKGLDLVLEAFAGMPECSLTVCGPVEREADFAAAFHKELYETPNIHAVGWVDVASQKFIDLTYSAVGTISASCSEGCSGSVVACMHAGLVPIISRQSGVDVTSSRGIVLHECSVAEIQHAVRSIANHSGAELRMMARNSWEYARATHTRERFAEAYGGAIVNIMQSRAKQIELAGEAPSDVIVAHPAPALH